MLDRWGGTAALGCGFARDQRLNSLVTGKITGNFFSRSRKAAWIAGFREGHAQEQGINREFKKLRDLVIG